MTQDQLRRRFLVQPEADEVRTILVSAFRQDDLGVSFDAAAFQEFFNTAKPADLRAAWYLYCAYRRELANYGVPVTV
jgi:hypothetical protein